jgi:hypothetical protein
MLKILTSTLMVAMLIGCSSSTPSRRPSDVHNYALAHTIDRSLEKQECQDRFQECLTNVCTHWQEACDVEPAYCQVGNWLHACTNSCVRKVKVCVER